MNSSTLLPRLVILPALLTTALLAGACSSGGISGGDTESSDAGAVSAEEAPAGAADPDVTTNLRGGNSAGDETASGSANRPPLQTRAVISTGTVTLAADDVGQARFDVEKVVATFRGELTDEQTATDDDGEVRRSRLVIRVPSESFDEVMGRLEKVAGLRSAERSAEDVTTQVIDTDARVRAQTQSLERIELLLGRAQTLRDIVAIESQLTRRQADLDSLKGQQAYLADQTSLSTITVFLERKEAKEEEPKKDDDTGFLAGLEKGWHGLVTVLTGAATALGAMLPFVVLLVLLGVPLWLLTRGLRRRRTPAVPM